jgi:tyrosinase
MRAEITIDGADAAGANYIGWAPIHGSVRLVEAEKGTDFVNVLLQNQVPDKESIGQTVFSCAFAGDPKIDPRNRLIELRRHDHLHLRLPANGTAVSFFIAGQFGRPSTDDKDAVIEVVETNTGDVLATKALMVRIRKNANDLTEKERDRFVTALAILNNAGRGKFSAVRDIHRIVAVDEAHTFPAFLSWHRAYLLDLERELQQIDPSVALPYWKWDEPAPNLFTKAFIGESHVFTADDKEGETPAQNVEFDATNPLCSWATDKKEGIERSPLFVASGVDAEAAHFRNPPGDPVGGKIPVLGEEDTLLLGESSNLYARFARMEGNPHGSAHTSFVGYIWDLEHAARDPLFFLLHANVDRLWAKWQWFYWRFSTEDPASYHPRPNRIGHYLNDTMWPWNQFTSRPRPVTAPGGTLASSPTATAPGPMPTVGDMFDYHGVIDPGNRLGFDYDDVPFELPLEVGPEQEE